MDFTNPISFNFDPQRHEGGDGGTSRKGHPSAQSDTLLQCRAAGTEPPYHAKSNYTKPFRGLPAEVRLMIWGFAHEEPLRALTFATKPGIKYRMHSSTFFNLLQVSHVVNKEVLEAAQKRLIFDFHTIPRDPLLNFVIELPRKALRLQRSIKLCMDEHQYNAAICDSPIVADRDIHRLRKQRNLRARHSASIEFMIQLYQISELHLVVSGTAWRQDIEEFKAFGWGEDENCNIQMPWSFAPPSGPLPLSEDMSEMLTLALWLARPEQVKIELSDATMQQKLLLSPSQLIGDQPCEKFLKIPARFRGKIDAEVTWERAGINAPLSGVCRLTRRDIQK